MRVWLFVRAYVRTCVFVHASLLRCACMGACVFVLRACMRVCVRSCVCACVCS